MRTKNFISQNLLNFDRCNSSSSENDGITDTERICIVDMNNSNSNPNYSVYQEINDTSNNSVLSQYCLNNLFACGPNLSVYQDSSRSMSNEPATYQSSSELRNCKNRSDSNIVCSPISSSINEVFKETPSPVHKEAAEIREESPLQDDANKCKFSPTMLLNCSSPLDSTFPFSLNSQTCVEVSTPNDSALDLRSPISCGPICRICHDGDEKERFISPCLCSGSMALVHKTCLERWLTTTSEGKCELCNFIYPVIRKPKSFRKFLCENEDVHQRRAVISDIACLCILTPLILVTTYLCIMAAIHFQPGGERESFNQSFPSRHPFRRPSRVGGKKFSNSGSYINRGFPFNSTGVKIVPKTEWNGAEFSGLIILTVVLLLIYLAWMTIAVKNHQRAWRAWRTVNQDLILVENKPTRE